MVAYFGRDRLRALLLFASADCGPVQLGQMRASCTTSSRAACTGKNIARQSKLLKLFISDFHG